MKRFFRAIGRRAHWAYYAALFAYFTRLAEAVSAAAGAWAWIASKLLLISYVALWLFATFSAIVATRILYGKEPNGSKRSLLLWVSFSVMTCILGFATAYMDVSYDNPTEAFNIGKPLTTVPALYFSIVTFATVGYGDITPTSPLTQIMVSAEIIIAMLYTVLIFSVIAGFIRQAPPKE